jgi:nitroreductase
MQPEEVLELMKSRRSVRSFSETPIPDSAIEMILEAARWCQSASNRQPWRFIVIKNKDLLEKIAKLAIYGRFIKQASVAIAIIADAKLAPNWYIHDTSMVSHQICLMAWALGIGTCWIGSLDRDKTAELLQIGKNEFVTTVLPLGYPEKAKIAPTERKELKNLVSYKE